MKFHLIYGILVILLVLGIFAIVQKSIAPGSTVPGESDTVLVTDFTSCAAAGYAVMESYPRQCRDADGTVYAEYIGNELEKNDLIRIEAPRPNQNITGPLVIQGEARGNWFFEATFPVVLTDWDGRIIAEHYAKADGEWMTEDFVRFSATLAYESPVFPNADAGHFSRRGALILQRSNPSGLPEHADALEIPVFFAD